MGIADGGGELLDLELLAVGFAVAVLSSAIPYSFELEALRRLPESTFGVLMSLEPAVAAAVGFVGLDQDLAAREVVAIGAGPGRERRRPAGGRDAAGRRGLGGRFRRLARGVVRRLAGRAVLRLAPPVVATGVRSRPPAAGRDARSSRARRGR